MKKIPVSFGHQKAICYQCQVCNAVYFHCQGSWEYIFFNVTSTERGREKSDTKTRSLILLEENGVEMTFSSLKERETQAIKHKQVVSMVFLLMLYDFFLRTLLTSKERRETKR